MAEQAPVSSSATPEASVPATNETLVGTPKESVATAPVTPAEEAPIVPVAKRKIKWGDSEREVTLDEAAKLAEKAWGIEEKAKISAQKAADAEALMDMIQNNPREFAKRCKAAGLDPTKMATEILYENIELNSLTAEQRELRELKAKEAEADALRKETEAAAKQADIDKKTQEWGIKFEGDLKKALEAKQLPMSRLTLALAAQYIDGGLAQKKEFTVEQVLPFVLRDLKNINMSTFGQLDGEDLLNYLGDDISNKVAAARVARYKKGTAPQAFPQKKEEPKGSLPKTITDLKGKAYWKALRQKKTADGIGAFPGQE